MDMSFTLSLILPFFRKIAEFTFAWAFGDMCLNAIISAVTGSEIEFYTNVSVKG